MPYRTRLIPLPGGVTPLVVFFTLRLAFSVFSSYVCSRKTAPFYHQKQNNTLIHSTLLKKNTIIKIKTL